MNNVMEMSLEELQEDSYITSSYTDLMRKGTNCPSMQYVLDSPQYQLSPEDMILEAESAALAGEAYEGSPIVGMDMGYKTPHSKEELLLAMCRRIVVASEERVLNGEVTKEDERRWKYKVHRRLVNIRKELYNKSKGL